MALGDQVGKQAADEIVAALPAVLKLLADEVTQITSTVCETSDKFIAVADALVGTVIPAFADGVSQVLALGERFAAGIYFESDPIPSIRFRVWSPAIPTGDEKK